jgi:phosphoesterase RecJ-like protein
MNATETAALLKARDNILILTHRRPDGDTIGCAAGLCLALRQAGKRAYVLPNEDATELFTPYFQGLEAPQGWEPSFVVAVDIAEEGLFPQSAKPWVGRVDLAIDHHPSNTGFGKANCVDASCAACGELVYDICRALGPVTAEIALPLYVAVSTDTGCFVYGNTTARTHRVAGELLELDIPYRQVNKRHFRTKSVRRLKLESLLMQSLELFQGDTLAIGAISLDDMAAIGATERDAEDIAAFIGQMEGVVSSVTIRELKHGECKLSLRTDPTKLNATKVCALLGGGGHASAAGCTVYGTVQQARAAVLQAIETVQKES